jgi:iron complex transport system substrate-binding protein
MTLRIFSLILVAALVLISAVPLAAQDAVAGFPVTVSDGAGVEVTFDQPAERVMCLVQACQDHLYALGIAPFAIADYMVSVYETLHGMPPADELPLVTTDMMRMPDLEQILALQPDVVIGALGLMDAIRTPLEDAGIPVLLSYPNSLEKVYADMEMVGAVTGLPEKAIEAVAAFDARMMAYAALSPNDQDLMLVFGGGGVDALFVETRQAQTCDTLIQFELTGCPFELDENAGQFASFGYAQYTVEAILNLDPDVIFFAGYDAEGVTDPAVLAGVAENPLWEELSAVKNGRVYSVDAWTFSGISGTVLLARAVDAAMPLIYPDIFPDGPLTDEQVQEILAEAATSDVQFPLTVVDADGEEHTFERAPERIVCLTNGCVENMAMVGVMPIAVGVVNYAIAIDPINFGEAAAEIIQIASPDGSPDFEQIASLNPDLVVGWSDLRPSLEGIAPLYSQYYSSENLDAFLLNTRNLGMITGRSEYTEEQIQSALDRVEAYSRLSPRDKSLFITQLSGDQPVFWSYPTNTFNTCGIIERVAICVYPESNNWQEMSLEGLLNINPDMIVLAKYDPSGTTVEEMLSSFEQNESLWNELRAVQNDAVYVFPPTQVEGYTIQSAVTMLDRVMPLLYPDIFPDGPLTEEQVEETLAETE